MSQPDIAPPAKRARPDESPEPAANSLTDQAAHLAQLVATRHSMSTTAAAAAAQPDVTISAPAPIAASTASTSMLRLDPPTVEKGEPAQDEEFARFRREYDRLSAEIHKGVRAALSTSPPSVVAHTRVPSR